jgi:nitrile hydratase beta subunit
MNGVHDMGGMHGLGPIAAEPEQTEPVFHEEWEGRAFGLNAALRALREWNLDGWRYQIESFPPAEYLRMSYYEKWLTANEQLVVKHGLASEGELRSGKAALGTVKQVPAFTAAVVAVRMGRGIASSVDPAVVAKFKAGDSVRALNIHPTGHTRLPRYARGKVGIIHRDHGVYLLPDTNAHGLGEHRQHVYSVRFTAQELWGDAASARDSVYIDLWDDYLEHS